MIKNTFLLIPLHEDKIINKSTKLFLIIIIAYLVIFIWKWKYLPPELPLFYSHIPGNTQLGTPIDILILPFLSIFFFTLNYIIACFIYKKSVFSSKISVLIGLTVSSFLLYSFIKIVFLIT
jgi:hypothetical protein